MSAALLALALSWLLCGLYLRIARRWQILDLPNERSSHLLPTPHGAGLPLFLALVLSVFAADALGASGLSQYYLLLGIAACLVLVGVFDDLRGLSVTLRFAVYALGCAVAVLSILGPLQAGNAGMLMLAVLAVVALLWVLNLYNFMDGIDGYAASQCLLACCGAALLAWVSGASDTYWLFCLLLAAAHAGFLFWNWPTARVFMGDAGSIPTGFLLGALALLGEAQGYLPLACWLIMLGVFITDASVTLLWRIVTGQPFTQPHRLHGYQRLSRHFGGHLPVLRLLFAVNLLWLIPLACLAALFPKYSILLVILAYLPLVRGMAKVKELG
ncbi:MAG: glycosyltransferase family 4 protein [Halioglobus sp.]